MCNCHIIIIEKLCKLCHEANQNTKIKGNYFQENPERAVSLNRNCKNHGTLTLPKNILQRAKYVEDSGCKVCQQPRATDDIAAEKAPSNTARFGGSGHNASAEHFADQARCGQPPEYTRQGPKSQRQHAQYPRQGEHVRFRHASQARYGGSRSRNAETGRGERQLRDQRAYRRGKSPYPTDARLTSFGDLGVPYRGRGRFQRFKDAMGFGQRQPKPARAQRQETRAAGQQGQRQPKPPSPWLMRLLLLFST